MNFVNKRTVQDQQVNPQKLQGSGVVAPKRLAFHAGEAAILQVNFLLSH